MSSFKKISSVRMFNNFRSHISTQFCIERIECLITSDDYFSRTTERYKSRDIKIIFPIMSNLIFLLDKSKMSNIKFYVCNKRVSDIYMCLKCKGILIKPFRYVQIFQTVPDFGRFHDGKLKLYWLFTGHS